MISKKAHVTADTQIGANVNVWQFASVIRGAVIGADCTIAANAIVDGAKIGARCIVGHGAGIHPGAFLGDDVFVGPGAVLCNDAWPRTHKRGFDPSAQSVTVEDGASIGAGAVVLPGVRIGSGAMVAAGAVVTRDVPAKVLYTASGVVAAIVDEEERTATRSRRRSKVRAAA